MFSGQKPTPPAKSGLRDDRERQETQKLHRVGGPSAGPESKARVKREVLRQPAATRQLPQAAMCSRRLENHLETFRLETEAERQLQTLDFQVERYRRESEALRQLRLRAEQAERELIEEREKLRREVDAERRKLREDAEEERRAWLEERGKLEQGLAFGLQPLACADGEDASKPGGLSASQRPTASEKLQGSSLLARCRRQPFAAPPRAEASKDPSWIVPAQKQQVPLRPPTHHTSRPSRHNKMQVPRCTSLESSRSSNHGDLVDCQALPERRLSDYLTPTGPCEPSAEVRQSKSTIQPVQKAAAQPHPEPSEEGHDESSWQTPQPSAGTGLEKAEVSDDSQLATSTPLPSRKGCLNHGRWSSERSTVLGIEDSATGTATSASSSSESEADFAEPGSQAGERRWRRGESYAAWSSLLRGAVEEGEGAELDGDALGMGGINQAPSRERCLPAERTEVLPHMEKTVWPDGRVSVLFQNGDSKERLTNGTVIYRYKATNTVQTMFADGTTVYHFASGRRERIRLDGSREVDYDKL